MSERQIVTEGGYGEYEIPHTSPEDMKIVKSILCRYGVCAESAKDVNGYERLLDIVSVWSLETNMNLKAKRLQEIANILSVNTTVAKQIAEELLEEIL